jgi:mannose-6-phosphate isomerase
VSVAAIGSTHSGKDEGDTVAHYSKQTLALGIRRVLVSKRMVAPLSQKLFRLEPQYRERVWGGQRLRAHTPPIGEVWCAFEQSQIQTGEHAGQQVGELAAQYNTALLGTEVAARFPGRFPLLIKVLDCADWLSVQVHPNDAQAERLVGPGAFGKTEAWHFLAVAPGATILAGVKPGTSAEVLRDAIQHGRVLDVARSIEVTAGETYLLSAGTLHALGPGLVLYEVQQSSDTTYRVYDWDRPASAGRSLHIKESIEVTDATKSATRTAPPALEGTASALAVQSPFFALDVVHIAHTPFHADTAQRSFHLLTATAGTVRIVCGDDTVQIGTYETALIAGSAGLYDVHAVGGPATLLRSSVPRE